MKRSFRILVFAMVFCYPWVSLAGNFDPTSIVEALLKIYDLEDKNLPNLSQLKDMDSVENSMKNDIENNLSGNFGYGALQNSDNDLAQRQWSNDSWEDVLSNTKNAQTAAFNQAQANYARLYPVADSSTISPTVPGGGLNRAYYQQASEISRSALAASSYSYDEINGHIQKLHDMVKLLDAQPSEVASVQLNARIAAEVGFIELEILKQETIHNQLLGTQTQDEVNGMSDAARFMRWQPQN